VSVALPVFSTVTVFGLSALVVPGGVALNETAAGTTRLRAYTVASPELATYRLPSPSSATPVGSLKSSPTFLAQRADVQPLGSSKIDVAVDCARYTSPAASTAMPWSLVKPLARVRTHPATAQPAGIFFTAALPESAT
jgi:hypothetical protein